MVTIGSWFLMLSLLSFINCEVNIRDKSQLARVVPRWPALISYIAPNKRFSGLSLSNNIDVLRDRLITLMTAQNDINKVLEVNLRTLFEAEKKLSFQEVSRRRNSIIMLARQRAKQRFLERNVKRFMQVYDDVRF